MSRSRTRQVPRSTCSWPASNSVALEAPWPVARGTAVPLPHIERPGQLPTKQTGHGRTGAAWTHALLQLHLPTLLGSRFCVFPSCLPWAKSFACISSSLPCVESNVLSASWVDSHNQVTESCRIRFLSRTDTADINSFLESASVLSRVLSQGP